MKVQFGFSNEKSFSTQIMNEMEITKSFMNNLLARYDWVTVIDDKGNYVTSLYC